jgi:hypothetical protein
VIVTPVCFGVSMIFDYEHFKVDIESLFKFIKEKTLLEKE